MSDVAAHPSTLFDYEPKGAGSPARTRVRRRPGLDFSVTGLVFIAMMLFMGLAGINSQANLLFGVFGLMIGILQCRLLALLDSLRWRTTAVANGAYRTWRSLTWATEVALMTDTGRQVLSTAAVG